MIHKRWELLDLFSQEDSITLKDKGLKQFIEYLLIHGLEELNKMFIHTFISLKELKLRNQSKTDIILSMKDIIQSKDKTYSPLALYFLIVPGMTARLKWTARSTVA